MRRINAGLQSRHHRLGRMIKAATCPGRNIDVPTRFSKLHRSVKNMTNATAMRRADMLDRETASDNFFVHVKTARNVTRVDVQETCLAGNHAAHTNFRQ